MSEPKKEHKVKERLPVTVHARPGDAVPISPSVIQLTNAVGKVVWHCGDLVPGATLLIDFQGDPRGPFAILEFAGNKVIGHGNRGPASTAWTYQYEVKMEIGGAVMSVATGTLQNTADEPNAPEPPPGPPWDNNYVGGDSGGN